MQPSAPYTRGRTLGSEGYPDPSVRLPWLDLLKVISAFSVVATHIASIGWQAMDPMDDGWFITSIYEIATRFAVPIFFMASGALLLNPRRELSIRRILTGYLPKTVAIALAASFVYCAIEWELSGWQGWRAVIVSALDGPYFIWYLWVLVGLYALTPLLRLISRDSCALGYAVALLAFFVMGRCTADAMMPNSPLTVWLDNFILFSSGMEGVFYYLLGAWLISHPLRRSYALISIFIGALSLFLAVALNYWNACANGPDLYYVARDNLLIALYSIGVWEAGLLLYSKRSEGFLLRSIVGWGMFIYLFHPMLRLIMERVSSFQPLVNWLLEAPLTAVPFISLLIWWLSVVSAFILGRIVALIQGALRARRRKFPNE